MRRMLGSAVAGIMLVVGLGCGHEAHAQRVISDYEASKLTLDALTATPVYHRPVVHHVAYRTSAHHAGFAAGHAISRRAMVHNVVYHPKAVTTAAKRRASRHRG